MLYPNYQMCHVQRKFHRVIAIWAFGATWPYSLSFNASVAGFSVETQACCVTSTSRGANGTHQTVVVIASWAHQAEAEEGRQEWWEVQTTGKTWIFSFEIHPDIFQDNSPKMALMNYIYN